MNKRIKSDLKQAISKVDSKPDSDFGDFELDLSTLPSVKNQKKKVTAMFELEVIELVEKQSKKYNISKSALMNDVLKKVLKDPK